MNEAPFDSLRAAWLRDAADPKAMQERLAAYRRRLSLKAAINIAGFIAIAAMFATFAWVAQQQRDVVFAFAALAFLAGLPWIVAGGLQTRRAARHLGSDSFGHLDTLLTSAKLELALLAGARGCAAILGMATAATLATTLFGLTSVTNIIWPTLAWTFTAITVWIWQEKRRTQLSLEIKNLDDLIRQFRCADAS